MYDTSFRSKGQKAFGIIDKVRLNTFQV